MLVGGYWCLSAVIRLQMGIDVAQPLCGWHQCTPRQAGLPAQLQHTLVHKTVGVVNIDTHVGTVVLEEAQRGACMYIHSAGQHHAKGRVSSALQETPVICQVQLYSGMKSIVNEHALLAQSNGLGRQHSLGNHHAHVFTILILVDI